MPDMMNPHYSEYYQDNKNEKPSQADSHDGKNMLLIFDNTDILYANEKSFRMNLELLLKRHKSLKVIVIQIKEMEQGDRNHLA